MDEDNTPRYGVAVGESETAVTEGGQTVVSRDGLLATFTSNRLTFWQNGAEAAWVSNGQWCCRPLTVQERIDAVGWRMDFTNGLAIKWMGE